MKEDYFIVVLAHSLHGRLRRVHIPHHVVYAVLGLALVGVMTVAGFLGSYVRMAWKVADYNALRSEFDSLRSRYQSLQEEASAKTEQMATLQMFANEVSMAYGITRELEGPDDISSEGPLIPTYNETLEQYDFLKSANFSIFSRKYPRLWQTNTRPTLWPLNGRFSSYFGERTDPLTGMGAFHPGVDIPAPLGTPVRAAGDGIVIRTGWYGAYGRLVVVDHGSDIVTYYGHLERIDVLVGQEVRRGQTIAASGQSGRVTGPHLHYEVRQGGSPVNPYIFLKNANRPANVAKREMPF